jgi:8-oxo-dGTP pyrophosphatase MutT (NUDIX family)
VLLTHHRKLNKWLQLGGHADGVEDLLQVAVTEAREESGILQFVVLEHDIFDIDIHMIPARKNEPEHFHFDVRYLLRAVTEAYTVSDESHDLAWIDTSMMSTLTTESSMIRMAVKWDGIRKRSTSMHP